MINFQFLAACAWVIVPLISMSQPSKTVLTLTESRTLAAENYPLIKQRNLIALSARYAIEQANKGYLPQLNVSGQATYQSEVTQIPLQVPGIDVPTLNKDQYKLYGEISQSLFDGGVIKLQKQAAEANAQVEAQTLEVELYKINERIHQLFFGILLLDAQLDQNELLRKDIQVGLDKTNAAIANGAALKSNGSLLEAELLRTAQRTVELQTKRRAYLHMLSQLINRPLDENTRLERPNPPAATSGNNRPELDWYTSQQNSIAVNRKLLTAKNLPKLNFFLQAGAGRPALNMLSNDFDAYYYGGIRLNIPISGFYTLKKERAMLDIKAQTIDVQKENFLFNNKLMLTQQNTESSQYEQLLETDDEIISLRASVKKAALAQLENGVINSSDYLREVHAEDSAKLAKILHQLQWLIIQYDIQYTTGN